MFRNDDFDVLTEVGDSTLGNILVAMPYFWVLTLVAFIFIAYYNVRHTNKGYRHRLPTIVVASVLVSAFLGAIFYDVGAGQAIDRLLTDKVPTYERFMHPRIRMWSRPESSMIAGVILECTDDATFRLQDFRQHVWMVHVTENSRVSRRLVTPGERIRCLCKPTGPDTLEAARIMPWVPEFQPIFRFMQASPERTNELPAY
jgi:hypothetical protein